MAARPSFLSLLECRSRPVREFDQYEWGDYSDVSIADGSGNHGQRCGAMRFRAWWFELFGRIGVGWLLGRFFRARVALAVNLTTAAGVFLLAEANSFPAGCLAAALIGVGAGGEAAITPYLLTRYFGLRAFSTLYGLTWTFCAAAAAIGPVILGRAFEFDWFLYRSAGNARDGAGVGGRNEPPAAELFELISDRSLRASARDVAGYVVRSFRDIDL